MKNEIKKMIKEIENDENAGKIAEIAINNPIINIKVVDFLAILLRHKANKTSTAGALYEAMNK